MLDFPPTQDGSTLPYAGPTPHSAGPLSAWPSSVVPHRGKVALNFRVHELSTSESPGEHGHILDQLNTVFWGWGLEV